MFNNIPPAGFPQIDLSQDVKRINAELSSMTSACTNIITDITAETATVTGNPISLSDALATDAISVVAEIEPSQDLHGYGKPWSGGSGKNKLPMTVSAIKAVNASGTWNGNIYTHVNGVEVTILTDNDDNVIGFNLNGTSNGVFEFRFSDMNDSLPSGSYIWSIQHTINLDGVWVSIYNPNATAIIAKTATSANYTCDGTFGGGYIYSNSGNTFDNVVIEPMLRLATETDTTFEPYTNICPISGMDSVTVTTTDGTDTNTATASLGTTIYGGSVDITEGSASVTMANISSYDGETIGEPWLSSMDEYVSGATPTTGAQVVYTLATPTTLSLTPTTLAMLEGENAVSTDAEEVSVEYIKNTLVGRVRRLEEEQ